VLQYAYRQSPVYLDPDQFQDLSLTPGVVQFDDPPAIQSGMINVILDSRGRLTYFQAIPKEKEVDTHPPPSSPVDWKPLFAAAGLESTQFQPAEAQWVSLAVFDARAAWTGTWPGSGRPLRIEAAAWRGKPVYFSEVGPWTTPNRMQSSDTKAPQHAGQIVEVALAILLLAGGAWVARRNYVKGKSDIHSAFRLASAVSLVEIAIWGCRDHFIPTLATFGRFVLAVSTGLFISTAVWMLYTALEPYIPYIRRHWPQAIISWSRLVAGRLRDLLVGRDVLWGVVLGVVWTVAVSLGSLALNIAKIFEILIQKAFSAQLAAFQQLKLAESSTPSSWSPQTW
jgi:hypothetical protein